MSISCGVAGTTLTITNAAQALGLRACPTYTGSIAVATSYQGDLGIFGVKHITESLSASNAPMLTTFESMDLESIGSSLSAGSLTAIANISFPALQSVPVLTLSNLGPVLSAVNFTSMNGGNVTFQQTWIENFDATSFQPTTLDNLVITQNHELDLVDLPSLTGSVGSIVISQNAGSPNVNLSNVNAVSESLFLNQLSTVDLTSIGNAGSVSISQSSITDLTLPKLSTVNTLAVNNNPVLNTLSLPQLQTISGTPNSTDPALSIANNTLLAGEITLPVITSIAGNAAIVGSFYTVSLPQLASFTTTMTLQSTQDINSTCQYFSGMSSGSPSGGKLVPGGIDCIFPGSTPPPVVKENSFKYVGAAIGAILGFIIILAAVVGFVLRARHRRRAREIEAQKEKARNMRKYEKDKMRARRWPGYGDPRTGRGGYV